MEESAVLSPSPKLTQFIKTCRERVGHQLGLHLELRGGSNALTEAMKYATLNGGKRLRPILAYGSVLAVGGNLSAADPVACAVELIHCYSLVHDDLPAMDDDDLRRGQPTVHKAFDVATAILVGDALQSLAFQILSEVSEEDVASADQDRCKDLTKTRLKMVAMLSQAAGAMGMVGGQALDFQAVGRSLDIGNLEALHKLKTGALIHASVVMGAMVGGNSQVDNHGFSAQIHALSEYAHKIGLAFQIQDDILDETGDTSTLGKPQGSDRFQLKPTYVSRLGLDAAKAHARELADQAVISLGSTAFPGDTGILRQLARYIVQRSH